MKVKDKEKLNNPLKGWQILSANSSMFFYTVHWGLVLTFKTPFLSASDLEKHYSEMHTVTEVDEAKANHVKGLIPTSLIQRIVPDKEFLTQNTKDLEAMAKEIPIEAL